MAWLVLGVLCELLVTLLEVDLSYIQRKVRTNKIHISICCMERPRSSFVDKRDTYLMISSKFYRRVPAQNLKSSLSPSLSLERMMLINMFAISL